jgi:hypothetical protein
LVATLPRVSHPQQSPALPLRFVISTRRLRLREEAE